MKALRIIFMGTPEFAVGILDSILQHNYNVVAVITAPDRPAGRGQKIKFSAVKEFAIQRELPVLQPTNLKDPSFIEQLTSYNANLQIVVAFRMLPEIVWKMPKIGTFNLHASLLPQYRGAAPINWALINGDKKTGVTTFFIDNKIDTGAIILSKSLDIGDNENAGSLHDRLMLLGSAAVVETLDLLGRENINLTIQPQEGDLKTAYKLNKDNTRIDWNQNAVTVHNLIRGLSPYPAAWTKFAEETKEYDVKIYESRISDVILDGKPGDIKTDKKSMLIKTRDAWIEISSIQFPGKKRMEIESFLNGQKLQISTRAY
ncbi:methionyl-tRNA formyltransferase [Flavobacterium ardleyense]|uniref:methionyl-tRNA formyltransferase n=1 Tax=Flavobacterium ardleyense TaxID=2038737 RepID=UPI00298C72B1|nr:methionyl-tRNA formyltransferase [Flavobacterium ardleyense]